MESACFYFLPFRLRHFPLQRERCSNKLCAKIYVLQNVNWNTLPLQGEMSIDRGVIKIIKIGNIDTTIFQESLREKQSVKSAFNY